MLRQDSCGSNLSQEPKVQDCFLQNHFEMPRIGHVTDKGATAKNGQVLPEANWLHKRCPGMSGQETLWISWCYSEGSHERTASVDFARKATRRRWVQTLQVAGEPSTMRMRRCL